VNAAWNWHPDGKTLVAKVEASMTDNTADLALLDARSDKTVSTIIQKVDIPFDSPAFSPDGNAMLVTVKNDGQEYLALADRQGNITRNLVTINGQVSFSWSPVTAKVAYVVQQNSGTDSATGSSTLSGGALHLLDVNSGEDKVLSQMPVLAFFWAPDGEHVAAFSPLRVSDIAKDFAGMDLTSNQSNSVMMLHTIDVNSRAFRQLFYFEPTTEFRRMLNQFDRFSRSMNIWSPDSRSLVFPMVYSNSTTSHNLIVETEATGSIEPRVISQGTLAAWSPK
jgi:Tol biopolymer transport system component